MRQKLRCDPIFQESIHFSKLQIYALFLKMLQSETVLKIFFRYGTIRII